MNERSSQTPEGTNLLLPPAERPNPVEPAAPRARLPEGLVPPPRRELDWTITTPPSQPATTAPSAPAPEVPSDLGPEDFKAARGIAWGVILGVGLWLLAAISLWSLG